MYSESEIHQKIVDNDGMCLGTWCDECPYKAYTQCLLTTMLFEYVEDKSIGNSMKIKKEYCIKMLRQKKLERIINETN
jgi:hypothetical protein